MGGPGDEVFEWLCTRRLDEVGFARVYVDAAHVKTRRGGEARYEALVAVTGASVDSGRVEILGIDAGDSEDPVFWTRLLLNLRARGLHGVETVESEEHGGLVDALAEIFPEAAWERGDGVAPPAPDRHRGDGP